MAQASGHQPDGKAADIKKALLAQREQMHLPTSHALDQKPGGDAPGALITTNIPNDLPVKTRGHLEDHDHDEEKKAHQKHDPDRVDGRGDELLVQERTDAAELLEQQILNPSKQELTRRKYPQGKNTGKPPMKVTQDIEELREKQPGITNARIRMLESKEAYNGHHGLSASEQSELKRLSDVGTDATASGHEHVESKPVKTQQHQDNAHRAAGNATKGLSGNATAPKQPIRGLSAADELSHMDHSDHIDH